MRNENPQHASSRDVYSVSGLKFCVTTCIVRWYHHFIVHLYPRKTDCRSSPPPDFPQHCMIASCHLRRWPNGAAIAIPAACLPPPAMTPCKLPHLPTTATLMPVTTLKFFLRNVRVARLREKVCHTNNIYQVGAANLSLFSIRWPSNGRYAPSGLAPCDES